MNDVLPAELVDRNRVIAERAIRPWTPVFAHGDLRPGHVFVDGDDVVGVIWFVAGLGFVVARATTNQRRRSVLASGTMQA